MPIYNKKKKKKRTRPRANVNIKWLKYNGLTIAVPFKESPQARFD